MVQGGLKAEYGAGMKEKHSVLPHRSQQPPLEEHEAWQSLKVDDMAAKPKPRSGADWTDLTAPCPIVNSHDQKRGLPTLRGKYDLPQSLQCFYT